MTRTPLTKAEREELQAFAADHINVSLYSSSLIDRALADLDAAEASLFQMQNAAIDLTAKLEAAEAERDRLRSTHAETNLQWAADLAKAEFERDRAESELDAERKMRVEAEAAASRAESERDALRADLDAAEAERDEAKELIAAARYDVGERSFLEDAQNILKECVAPYSCEQMQAVAKVLRQWRDKWAILLETLVRSNEERDDAEKAASATHEACANAISRLAAAQEEIATMRAERDAALLILPACCGSLADAADTMRQELVQAEFERNAACEERDALKARCRSAAQTIIEAIGAPGPEDVGESATRIVAELADAKAKLAALVEQHFIATDAESKSECVICLCNVEDIAALKAAGGES